MGWPFNSSKTALVVESPKPATYDAVTAQTGPSGGGPGGQNKAMMSILNPGGSGKKLTVIGFGVQAESTSGTNLIVHYEVRRISAHTAGTAFTPMRRELTDAAAVAEVYQEPASVTEIVNPKQQTFFLQSNTQQAPMTHYRNLTREGGKGIVLAEGEGLVLHQVTSNGGIFHTSFVWTEE